MKTDRIKGFITEKILLPEDNEGTVEATLVKKTTDNSSEKAILYIHGFVDYFFQYHFADWLVDNGWNFYALDLRKYGRSLLKHQKPNMISDLRDYFNEIDISIDLIKSRDKNDKIVMIGHSTGGLISTLYADYHKDGNKIEGLILNSPFFEFKNPPWFRKIILPIVAKLGRKFPKLQSPEGLKEGYASSIHKDYHGIWEFDLDKKPIGGFSINFGWISAIFYGHRSLQSGLDINVPILVMYSSKSVKPGRYNKNMHSADAVLNVDHIKQYSKVLGKKVNTAEIQNGIHDLVLSNEEARKLVYSNISEFLNLID